MNAVQSVQDYICERRGIAKSFCSRCLARALSIDIGQVIQAMQALEEGGRYRIRWGTCSRCNKRWAYVINTTLIARGETINEPEEGEANAEE